MTKLRLPKWAHDNQRQEVYTNKRYEHINSLQKACGSTEEDLSELLSIKIDNLLEGLSGEYLIETKKYLHNIGTYRQLDLVLCQYNKITGQEDIFNPYSNPGYEFFASLVIGHHYFFNRAPDIHYTDTDIDARNQAREVQDLPLEETLRNLSYDFIISGYLFHEELFEKDDNGIYRLIPKNINKAGTRTDEGIGFTNNELIFRATPTRSYTSEEKGAAEIRIPRELIPLYIQAYVDTNRKVSTEITNLHTKKISQALDSLLSLPQSERNSAKMDQFIREEIKE